MPTLCPIALVTGCKACPIFSVCPLKGVIGDQRPADAEPEPPASKPKPRKRKRAR